MDTLAAPYVFVLELRQSLEAGVSLNEAIKCYLATAPPCSFTRLVERWWLAQSSSTGAPPLPATINMYRRTVFDVLELSRRGAGIVEPLRGLELEFEKVCLNDLDRHLDKLPFKLMIPMLLLQFPAVLLLMLGPLLIQFLAEVSS